MDSLKDKLETNNTVFVKNGSHYYHKKEKVTEIEGFYERFVNWVSGEFDLLLQSERDDLIVYFPNGSFRISNSINEQAEVIKVEVKGKSRKSCRLIMQKLESIYNHVGFFQIKKGSDGILDITMFKMDLLPSKL